MATFCRCLRAKRSFVPSRLQSRRHGHGQILWERLLGRNVDSSLATALEDAASQYTTSQRVPSWLPFLPNSSFWLPPSEDAEKKFEGLIELLDEAPPARSRDSNENSSLKIWVHDDSLPRISADSAIQEDTDEILDPDDEAPIEKGQKVLFIDLMADIGDEDTNLAEDDVVVVEVADDDDF